MRITHIVSIVLFLALAFWVASRSPHVKLRVQSAALAVASPFIKSGSAMEQRATAFRNEVRDSAELARENERLRRELDLLRIYSRDRSEIYDENRRLARALDYRERSAFNLLPARVIQRERNTWWSTVTIDRGFENGLAVGAAVIVPEGLVGRVITVAPSTSVILLLTDSHCKVAARTLGSLDLRAVVTGSRGNTGATPFLTMGPLPLDTEVESGRQVLTTGSGLVFPPNYPVGTIESIEQREFYSVAQVRPAADFKTLDQVFVVLSEKRGGES